MNYFITAIAKSEIISQDRLESLNIVNRGNWLWIPANFKAANKQRG